MTFVQSIRDKVALYGVNLGFLIAGYSIMVIYAYFDNIRSPLIPVFSQELMLSYSQTSIFLIGGYIGSIFTSLMLLTVLNKFSAKAITIFIASIIIAACAGSVLVQGFYSVSILGVCFGSCISIFSSMPNVFVVRSTPLHLQGKIMSGLHTMYGLGAMTVPWIAGYVTRHNINWVWLFWCTIPIMLVLIIYISCLNEKTLKVTSSDESKTVDSSKKISSFSLSGLEIFSLIIFAIYVAGEVTGSMWMTTMLIEKYQHTVDSVKLYMTGYFAILSLTRIICFFSVPEKLERVFIIVGGLGGILSFVLVALGFPIAFIFYGLIGPIYPLFLARISRNAGKKASAMAVWVLMAIQTVLSLAHFVVAKMMDVLGVHLTMFVPPCLLTLTICLLFIYFWIENKRARITA